VSQYQKGKTNLDFTEARDSSGSGISWDMCKPATRSRQITMPAPPSQIFTGRMPFLPPNQQRQSTIHAPKIEVYGGYHPLNGEWQQKEPQKAHVYAENIM